MAAFSSHTYFYRCGFCLIVNIQAGFYYISKKESSVLNQVHCQVGVSGWWFVCYLVDSGRIGTGWVKGKSPPGSPPTKEATAVTFVSLSPERRFKSGVAKA